MIDWDDLIQSEEPEDLKALKAFLFRENMRIAAEKKALEEKQAELQKLQDDFMRDRVALRDELNELNRRTLEERKRLREDNQFFDKKMAILQDGFRSLEEDRRNLEREKRQFESYRERMREEDAAMFTGNYDEIAAILFDSVGNQIGLRKRYKDLVKIFHPDNLFGDEKLSAAINREFQRRREELA